MNVRYFFFETWSWLIHTGVPLLALLILGLLIPRLARLTTRIITRRLSEGEESTKATLALVGALVYVLQIIAYFLIILIALTLLGVPPMGAAVPATVVSAAIGFGAQNVIGDFLAGFFIISERQFGVGDYVSFDGTSNSIEGTVVALTLRSTKVRTPAGELVTVPNGSAGVITNFSQDWSRAVVDLDLPLLPGESMQDLTARVEKAARAAIRDPEIANNIIGELEVLPAMNVTQPAVAGQAWSVSFRAMVQVEPAMQWAVARVIRARLINAFWDRYDSSSVETRQALHTLDTTGKLAPGTLTPNTQPTTEPATQHTDSTTVTVDAAPTQKINAAHPLPPAQSEQPEQSQGELTLSEAVSTDDLVQQKLAQQKLTQQKLTEHNTDSAHTETEKTDTTKPGHTTADNADATVSTADTTDATSTILDDSKVHYDSAWKNALTIGGRFRASTTALVSALLILGSVALLSATPENGQPGVLSPDRWRGTPTPQTESSQTPTDAAETTTSTLENTAPAETSTHTSEPQATNQATGQDTEHTTGQAAKQTTENTSTGNAHSSTEPTSQNNQQDSQTSSTTNNGHNTGQQGTRNSAQSNTNATPGSPTGAAGGVADAG